VILGVSPFGEGAVRLRVLDGETVRRALIFHAAGELVEGMRVDLLYEVRRTSWQGDQQIDLVVREARPIGPNATDRLV
jgi:hypothetical protein